MVFEIQTHDMINATKNAEYIIKIIAEDYFHRISANTQVARLLQGASFEIRKVDANLYSHGDIHIDIGFFQKKYGAISSFARQLMSQDKHSDDYVFVFSATITVDYQGQHSHLNGLMGCAALYVKKEIPLDVVEEPLLKLLKGKLEKLQYANFNFKVIQL